MKFPRLSILALAAMSGIASGTVVNIDFNTATSATYSGLAAAPDTVGNNHWNPLQNVTGTASSVALNDSTNTATGIGFSLTGIDGSISNINGDQERSAGGGYGSLMRDYIRIDSASGSTVKEVTGKFTGLVVGASYDLYFYGQGENFGPLGGSTNLRGQNSLFTVGGVEKQTSWDTVAGGDGLMVENIEFVKFSTIADANGEIIFEWANVIQAVGGNVVTDAAPSGGSPVSSRFGALNAIQLVSTVPEPSSALLGALGVLGLIARRRR